MCDVGMNVGFMPEHANIIHTKSQTLMARASETETSTNSVLTFKSLNSRNQSSPNQHLKPHLAYGTTDSAISVRKLSRRWSPKTL